MTKVKKVSQRSGSRHLRSNPYPLQSSCSKIINDSHNKKQQKTSEKKDWQDAKCSVCMEYPHNAVLLLCSSYHKGCRPYMCATSFRYSNCLDQYKKAYTKPNPTQISDPQAGPTEAQPFEKPQIPELLCPLCRGEVKGWTVVERARKFLNSKKRSCMQENCSFIGSYRDLRKHVRADHPWARPREVDPSLVEKWKKLENDSELNDVMSTISSMMPGSIVMGDYVIEPNFRGFSRGREVDNYLDGVVFRLGSYDAIFETDTIFETEDDDDDDNVEGDSGGGASESRHVRNYIPRIGGRRQGRVLSGGTRRRRVRGVGR